MKKIVATLMAAAVLVLAVAGCQGAEATPESALGVQETVLDQERDVQETMLRMQADNVQELVDSAQEYLSQQGRLECLTIMSFVSDGEARLQAQRNYCDVEWEELEEIGDQIRDAIWAQEKAEEEEAEERAREERRAAAEEAYVPFASPTSACTSCVTLPPSVTGEE